MTKENMNINEILSDNELDQVVGGFAEESFSDMNYLKEQCGVDVVTGDYDTSIKFLKENYASAGIKFRPYDHKANEYRNMRTGKALSHNEALSILVDYAHRHGRWG